MASASAAKPVTQLLQAAGRGDEQAAAKVFSQLYTELRNLAQARMNKCAPGHTLQATALVHEAYLRLLGKDDPGWESRGHFFFAAARAMRDILVEHARKKSAGKRGGDRKRVDLANLVLSLDAQPDDILALDSALERLEREEPRKHQIVMLHFFAGLTLEQTAESLGVGLRTVERDWRFARVLLYDELAGESGERTGTDADD